VSTGARDAVLAALGDVAPDVDPAAVAGSAHLQQDLELDSLDFLDLLAAVAERTGVEVPERDYEQVATLDGLVTYVEASA
jgi:acyl carrier protein